MTDRGRRAARGMALAAALGAGGIGGQIVDRLTSPDRDTAGQVQLLRADLAELRTELRASRGELRDALRDQRDRDRDQDLRIAARPLQRNPDLVTPALTR